jgi:hypothetical protein
MVTLLQRLRERKLVQWAQLHRLRAAAYAGLGDVENALAALELAFTTGYRNFGTIANDSLLAKLGDHPRFQELLECE